MLAKKCCWQINNILDLGIVGSQLSRGFGSVILNCGGVGVGGAAAAYPTPHTLFTFKLVLTHKSFKHPDDDVFP